MDIFLIFWFSVAQAMSLALAMHHPEIDCWNNALKSMSWPVTILEIYWGQLDEDFNSPADD